MLRIYSWRCQDALNRFDLQKSFESYIAIEIDIWHKLPVFVWIRTKTCIKFQGFRGFQNTGFDSRDLVYHNSRSIDYRDNKTS